MVGDNGNAKVERHNLGMKHIVLFTVNHLHKISRTNHVTLPRLRLRARRFEHIRSNYAGSLYLFCNPCVPVLLAL